MEHRIVELEKSKEDFQRTLEKIQTEKEFLENNTRPIDTETIETLKRENEELKQNTNKLQMELIELIKR